MKKGKEREEETVFQDVTLEADSLDGDPTSLGEMTVPETHTYGLFSEKE